MQEHCGLVIQQEGEGDEFGHDSAVIFIWSTLGYKVQFSARRHCLYEVDAMENRARYQVRKSSTVINSENIPDKAQ